MNAITMTTTSTEQVFTNAAMAICQLNGYNVNGRPLKCSVG